MLFASGTAFDHVMDSESWEFFHGMVYDLPGPFTKFVVLQLIAACLIMAIYIPLARKVRNGDPVRGPFWNAFESVLTFLRNQVAKPSIGHDADKYVPYLWTLFLFILTCNLLGMIPFGGSATASLAVTAALALTTFLVIHGSAIAEMGFTHYLKSYIPHLGELPLRLNLFVVPLIVIIEVNGNIIKAVILAIRLFANMFAGHTVLAMILMFVVMARDEAWYLFWPVTIGSVIGVTLLSLLELLVAFLQAYVFVFLTSLFLGATLHPQH